MDVVAKASGGQNVVARAMAAPHVYRPAEVPAAYVRFFLSFDGEPARNARVVEGRFAPGAPFSIPSARDIDRDLRLYIVSYSADDTPSVSRLEDAVQLTIPARRETNAPKIGQDGQATADSVRIGITDFNRYARMRRLTVSANPDMSDPLLVLTLDSATYVERELARYFVLERALGGALKAQTGGVLLTEPAGLAFEVEGGEPALPLTVYVTVAHSSGAAWTPESNVLGVTFAAADGTGGSDGDFDPNPIDRHKLDPIV